MKTEKTEKTEKKPNVFFNGFFVLFIEEEKQKNPMFFHGFVCGHKETLQNHWVFLFFCSRKKQKTQIK